MRSGFLCAVLLLLALPAIARKDSGKSDTSDEAKSDREAAAQSRERKSDPPPTPAIVLPTAVPVATPEKDSPKRGGKPNANKPDDQKPGNSKDKPNSDGRDKKADSDKGDKKKKDKKQKDRDEESVHATPVNTDAPQADEPTADSTQESTDPPMEATPHLEATPAMPGIAVTTENTDKQSDENTPEARRVRRERRRSERTPAPVRPTVFVPTGTPPPAEGATPARIIPRPVRTPSAEKLAKQKKRKVLPTPGPTPVPTPATATPTPANFQPPPHWKPAPGWMPPPGWKPPVNWSPAGGWIVPPGWRPPKGWVLRLYKWGWCYVPKRGWVCPPHWSPPPSFITPPGWYYLPQDDYESYQVSDPSVVIVTTGIARPDLVEEIDTEESYTPSDAVAEEISEDDEGMDEQTDLAERPVPEEPPDLGIDSTVEDIVRALTRTRDPELRYAGPVYATQQIQFEDEDYAILPQSFETLDALGEALLDKPLENAIVSIEAHLNDSLDDDEARTLTRRRAWSVKGYLVQKFGLDPERLVFIGYGNDAPIAPHDTDDGLAMNERVEIENVSDLFTLSGAGIEFHSSAGDEDTTTPVTETGTQLLPLSSDSLTTLTSQSDAQSSPALITSQEQATSATKQP